MPKDTNEILVTLEQSVDTFKAKQEQTTKALEDTLGKTGEDAKAAIAKADKLAGEVQSLADQILAVQQKVVDNVVKGQAPVKTLASIVTASPEFAAFSKGGQSFRINCNTITGQEGSPPANSDTLVQKDRKGFVDGAYRALRLRDIIPSDRTSSNQIEYTKENVFTNAAAETAEGGSVPESSITYTLVSRPVSTIPHLIYVSEQALADSDFLASHIDRRLRYGVALKYESQLINGTGVGQAISGLLDSGNFTAFTPTAGENALDSVNRAIEAVALADYNATGIIMNTSDWHTIERLKVGASDDRYIVGDPLGMISARLWGLPVVVTNQMTTNTFAVGAFDVSHAIVDRQDITVEMSREHKFDKLLVAVRAYQRGTLASYRPASCYAGNLVSTAS